jgi:glycosyltransferase involved in cell wall biosynthesis
MKVLMVHNKSRGGGGADSIFDKTVKLLALKGVQVYTLVRSSSEVGTSLKEKLKTFAYGIHSPSVYSSTIELIKTVRPDIVHVHELYPLLASVFRSCGDAGLPVVMSLHNFRLICPVHTCFSNGIICDKCAGRREHWCILKNCRGSLAESFAFAVHRYISRKTSLVENNVSLFISPSYFAKNFFLKHNITKSEIVVLPHMVQLSKPQPNSITGSYVGYSGRLDYEKGIHILIEAALRVPQIQFLITGKPSQVTYNIKHIPNNIKFVGWLTQLQLVDFYRNARFTVVPSIWYETFGLVAIEAMSYGLPVVASRCGALPEIVDDGITGLLFEKGNISELASKIKLLWENPILCRQMGVASREKVIKTYNKTSYFERLMSIYKTAIAIKKRALNAIIS